MHSLSGCRAGYQSAVRSNRPWLLAMLAVLLAALGACGGSSPSPSPTATPPLATASAEATPAVTPAPTPSPTLAAATSAPTPPGPFASKVYPYTLELPSGLQTRRWTEAVVAWDGTARFGTDSRAVDITGTVDGALLIFGLPWNGDLAGFMDLIAESATRFHGCAAVDDASPFEVNGVAGLSQHEVCAQNTPVLSTVLVNGGHALAIRVMVNADKVDVIFDHVVTWLSGLTWEGS